MMISWNIRGLNKQARCSEVKPHLRKFQGRIGTIVITITHPNGRVWLMWKPNIWDVKVIKETDQVIHSVMYMKDGSFSHFLSDMYAHNQIAKRKQLWENIQEFGNTVKGHWIVIGDFNNVLKINDIIGGNEYNAIVKNSWEQDELGRPMYKLWKKLIRLQPHLRKLTTEVTRGVQNIQDSRVMLDQAQKALSADMFNQQLIENEKFWCEEVINNTELEEKILLQKSKIDWLKLGDGNNQYFYANLKEKNRQASLHKLEDKNGRSLTEFTDMENEILNFYGELIGTASPSLPHVDIEALRRGRQLPMEKHNCLINLVSETEIWQALQSIGDNKASRADGYNALF
ncbi:uncharacterized protein LOC131595109 [Vicia villosa]|uniref:uncharacterized protein LOC131595109 n=1 Tax=Vicia villosa TaxID=3911 RepID=UPI00273AFC82|nr:uncharacterized protein LOC131595109 [Vicia villosa]